MLIPLSEIIGYAVQASDKPAGKVADVYVDDVTWAVRHVAVSDAGGVGIQMASVDPDKLGAVDTAAHKLHVKLSQEEIAGGPDVSTDPPVSRHINEENDPRLRSIDEIKGYKVLASDGAVGALDDFIVGGEGDWKVHFIVVATDRGGKVLVGPGLIDRLDFDAKTAHVEVDKSHFDKSPAYDPAQPIARVEDVELVGREGI